MEAKWEKGGAGIVLSRIKDVEEMKEYENKKVIEDGDTYGMVDASSYER